MYQSTQNDQKLCFILVPKSRKFERFSINNLKTREPPYSRCKIQCNAPWVSSDPADPNGTWKVECRGNKDPKWKTPSNGGRSDHSCTLITTSTAPLPTTVLPVACPKTSEQAKPRGAKIVSTVTKGGVAVGLELKLRFDTKYSTNNCQDFTFAIASSVPFPEDASFQERILRFNAGSSLKTIKMDGH